MTDHEPPRPRIQRKQDVLTRLAKEEDIWVATASADGEPCLVPLWFLWDVTGNDRPDAGTLLFCTKRNNPTARNLTPKGELRLSLGHTRDVVLIDGTAEKVEGTDLPTASADAFAAKLPWDPRDRTAWVYLRVTPRTVRAWNEEHELAQRVLMRDGEWLV
ncbi:pyridoxamine 5'-phosphate oxidase family protein [Streptomyces sp. NPDC050848]|uniref:pyridoxamine 5'-phosphate oxidase family protein n=1 Tax=Streptomyces sp. NPDC050848 TaxID=3155791 RepID=UPI0033D6A879